MKRQAWLAVAFAVVFALGYALSSAISAPSNEKPTMKRATGIGGIFFKCKDPKAVREWYGTHLGLTINPYGSTFAWYQGADSTKRAFTQWSPFKETTKYFDPSTKEFMINYRVDNLTSLVDSLKAEGVTVVDTIETYSYGKFVHIMDNEGNKVELWEAYDDEYSKIGSGVTK
jgi:predicted enzyme related to lactoylglutathione lyase